jgi:hypothetical protein
MYSITSYFYAKASANTYVGPRSTSRRNFLSAISRECSTSAGATLVEEPVVHLDYSLIGVNSSRAVEKGLAEAEWYQCAVPRKTMRQLLERRYDGLKRDHTEIDGV